MRRALVALVALVALAPAVAVAGEPAEALRAADDALETGDYDRAAGLVEPLIRTAEQLEAIDLAEAYRLYGLSLFFLDRLADAEHALLRYLQLEPDAHLDPARYPPEAIVFFEDIRARHRAELAGLHQRPRSVSEWSKNLFPPWGQFANGHDTKGWIIAGLTLASAAAHLGSFVLLDRWCDPVTGVCKSGSRDRRNTALALQVVNVGSGVLLIGTLAYGVIDGFYYHRKRKGSEMRRDMSVGVSPKNGGGVATVSIRF
jgi:hypothetical protein